MQWQAARKSEVLRPNGQHLMEMHRVNDRGAPPAAATYIAAASSPSGSV